MLTKKNIAVVGCGYWGKNLIRNFSELNVLKCVCDFDKNLADNYAKKYNVKNIDFEKLLYDENISGIVLAIPARLHCKYALMAMQNKKHVFVEKPLAMSIKEGEEMIKAASKNQVHLMVGHLLQYHPVFSVLKNLVNSKKYGDLIYAYSNRFSMGKLRSIEDVIWSFAPHDISMLLSLFADDDVEAVSTNSSSFIQDNITDTANINIRFKSGKTCQVGSSWISPQKEQKLVAICEKAILVFDDTNSWNEKLSILDYEVDLADKSNPTIHKKDMNFLEVLELEPLNEECKYFVNLISNLVPPKTDGKEGLRVLQVLNAASRSQITKKEILLNE